jgi:tetratricopeptide (TPR) repeat protein
VVILGEGGADLSSKEVQRGYRLIVKAERSSFEDKQSLKDAIRAFINAIACNRSKPEGWVGMGYIALLVEQNAIARRYLEKALQLDSTNEDAQKLLNYLGPPNPAEVEKEKKQSFLASHWKSI